MISFYYALFCFGLSIHLSTRLAKNRSAVGGSANLVKMRGSSQADGLLLFSRLAVGFGAALREKGMKQLSDAVDDKRTPFIQRLF